MRHLTQRGIFHEVAVVLLAGPLLCLAACTRGASPIPIEHELEGNPVLEAHGLSASVVDNKAGYLTLEVRGLGRGDGPEYDAMRDFRSGYGFSAVGIYWGQAKERDFHGRYGWSKHALVSVRIAGYL